MEPEEYLKPQSPYTGYSDLHFATESQDGSGLMLAEYDRGELTMAAGRVSFRVMGVQFGCTGVTSIALVRKALPWAIVLATA
jgi:hypothetical protein